MALYNEVEYVRYAIESVIKHVDRFIVIEGAFAETVATGGSERSDDGTINILNQLKEKYRDKLIRICPEKPLQQLQHRNLIFRALSGLGYDDCWMWLVDGDEVYTDDQVQNLKRVLDETQFDCVKIKSLTFINNFVDYANIAFPRLYRIRPGYQYRFSAPNDLMQQVPPTRGFMPQRMENREDEVYFYHYSYVKDPARFLQKKREREKLGGSFKWFLEDGQVTCPNYHPKKFTGIHPEIMKGHPRYHELP